MANPNTPYGFRPLRYKNGSDWNGMANPYYIPSSDGSQYQIGDAVVSAANGDVNGIPAVAKATGTATVRGVVVGVLPVPPLNQSLQAVTLSLENVYIPATKSQGYYVLVCDDPNVLYAIQDDGASALTATSCNKNASFTVTNPSVLNQQSASVLGTATVNTTQGLNLKMMGLVLDSTNAFGIYADWVVSFNQHELGGSNTAGV